MTLALSPKTREVLDWLDARRRETAQMFDSAASEEYNQIVGVSDESDTVSGGPGSLLTPEGRGRSRTRGVSP